jgi:hypothetical protein
MAANDARHLAATKRHGLDWVTPVCTAIIACTGVLALAYAHWQLKEAHEEAQVQHLLALEQQYEKEPMVTYRKLYAQKRLAGVEDPPERDELLGFFENVGLLVKRGYLRDSDVWELFSTEIFPLYADSRDEIEQDRKDDPPEYSNLTELVNRLEAIETSEKGTLAKPSKDDLKDYWKNDADIGAGAPMVRGKPKERGNK